jgi:hypothetical protein
MQMPGQRVSAATSCVVPHTLAQVQQLVVVQQAPYTLPDHKASEGSLGRLRKWLTFLLCLRRGSTLWWYHKPL